MTAEKHSPQMHVADISEDPIVLGLKQLYDSVLEEAIPDDFMGFLTQIDAACEAKSGKDQIEGNLGAGTISPTSATEQGTGQ